MRIDPSMDTQERDGLARMLGVRRDELVDQAREHHRELGNTADAAFELSDAELVECLSDRDRAEMVEIEAAFERLDAGTYGRCLRCGQAIRVERLRERPAERHCATCA